MDPPPPPIPAGRRTYAEAVGAKPSVVNEAEYMYNCTSGEEWWRDLLLRPTVVLSRCSAGWAKFTSFRSAAE